MQKETQAKHASMDYESAALQSISLETECSFLSASYLIDNVGQEYGPVYDMGTTDDTGNIFNPDWDFGN